jgi:hypothetical protein
MQANQFSRCLSRSICRRTTAWTVARNWAFAVLTAVMVVGCVRRSEPAVIGYPSDDALYKGETLPVTTKLRNGTANLEEVFEWCRLVHYLGESNSFKAREYDFEDDGKPELAVCAESWAGTGGNTYLVFKQTAKGFRFFDVIWMGGFVRVSPAQSHTAQIITLSHLGGGDVGSEYEADLLEVRPSGFEEVARRVLSSKDGPLQGQRWCELLFSTNVVSGETAHDIFAFPK